MKPLKTKHFLILINGAVLVCAFLLLVFLNGRQLKSIALGQNKKNLRTFASVVEKALGALAPRDLDGAVKSLASPGSEIRISLINAAGFLAADSGSAGLSGECHLDRGEVAASLRGEEAFALRRSTVDGQDELYYASPVRLGGEIYSLRLSMPLGANIYWSGNYFGALLLFSALVLAAVLCLSFLLSNYVLKGIESLKAAAVRYQAQNFAYESRVASPKELAELSKTMNAMAKTIGGNVARLERLERVRKDFVANVSHELKTPVTSIKGYSETLLDGALEEPETARNFVAIIQSQTARLESIIEDLLALSALERDDCKIDLCEADVALLLEKLCADFAPLAQRKGVSLRFSCEGGAARCAKVNAGLFAQAVANVIDNAVKHCPRGAAVEVSLAAGEVGKLCVAVEDSGAGIPEELRERVFERFFRVDKGRSRENGGTGLGLAITKHIIELHGGTVCCQAARNFPHGARFVIEL